MMYQKILILAILAVALHPATCHSQSSFSSESASRKALPVRGFLAREKAFEKFLNMPWSGDDSRYSEIRTRLETAQREGKLDTSLDFYRSAWQKDLSSPTAQFGYFYGLWLNRTQNDLESQSDQANDSAFDDWLLKLQFPRTYNFTRLAGLCMNRIMLGHGLMPFIDRLMKADPNDLECRNLPGLLASTNDPAQQLRAIKLADENVAKWPELPLVHSVQGYVYYVQWLKTKDPVMGQKSLAAYQEYLRLAPPNAYDRDAVENPIKRIQHG